MKDRIRTIRKTFNLTQGELAAKLGVSISTISFWEKGENVPEGRIKLICKEFSISEEWLRTGNGSMRAEKKAREIHEFTDEEIMIESGVRIYRMMPENVKKLFDKVIESIRRNNGDPTKAYEYIRKSLDRIPR